MEFDNRFIMTKCIAESRNLYSVRQWQTSDQIWILWSDLWVFCCHCCLSVQVWRMKWISKYGGLYSQRSTSHVPTLTPCKSQRIEQMPVHGPCVYLCISSNVSGRSAFHAWQPSTGDGSTRNFLNFKWSICAEWWNVNRKPTFPLSSLSLPPPARRTVRTMPRRHQVWQLKSPWHPYLWAVTRVGGAQVIGKVKGGGVGGGAVGEEGLSCRYSMTLGKRYSTRGNTWTYLLSAVTVRSGILIEGPDDNFILDISKPVWERRGLEGFAVHFSVSSSKS